MVSWIEHYSLTPALPSCIEHCCGFKVLVKRRCGHEVKIPCKVKTSSLPPCKEMCLVTSPLCGHDIEVPCHSMPCKDGNLGMLRCASIVIHSCNFVSPFFTVFAFFSSRVQCEPWPWRGHGAFATRGAARCQATRDQHAARAARACEDLQEDTSSLGLISTCLDSFLIISN